MSMTRVSRRAFMTGIAGAVLAGCAGGRNTPSSDTTSSGIGSASGAVPTRPPSVQLPPIVDHVSIPPDLGPVQPTLFQGVRLWDGEVLRPDMDVLLDRGVISRVGQSLSKPGGR